MRSIQVDIDNKFWLASAKKVPSPFFDQRPEEESISLLVIHNISLPPRQYGGDSIERFFTGKLEAFEHPFFHHIRGMKVSAHCLVRRDGELVQFVALNQRAWHAGLSSFAGKPRCNDYSIGIELEGSDFENYTPQQYKTLAELTNTLRQHFPLITKQRITGHQFIAPLRKSDPGLSFDWRYFYTLLD